MKTCSYCNKKNTESAKFCYNCGNELKIDEKPSNNSKSSEPSAKNAKIFFWNNMHYCWCYS